MTKQQDVLVIGAGIAGLACAKYLQQQGQQVKVLEARNRLGGRIYSVQQAEITLDFGASWVHGIMNNPIWHLVRQADISSQVFNYSEAIFFDETGQPWQPSIQQQFEDTIHQIEQQLQQSRCQNHQSAEHMIQQILEQPEFNTIARQMQMTLGQLKLHLKQYFAMFARDPYGCELSQLSADYPNYEGYFKGDEVVFPQGYGQLIEYLAQEIDIQKNTEIVKVERLKDGVVVTDQYQQYHQAKHVVCTVPLGVLKRANIQFQPELPASYQSIIESMGFGAFNKVFFRLTQSLELIERYQKQSYWFATQQGWLNLLDFSKVYQRPMYLMLLGGASAQAMEHLDQQTLWAGLRQQLQPCLPKHAILPAQAEQLYVTHWSSDPYSYGAYSYPCVGHSSQWSAQLRTPIDECLWFAGEHCHPDYAATVHGAYLSGCYTAEQILQSSLNPDVNTGFLNR